MNLGRYLKVGMILGAAGYIAGVGAVVLLSDLDFVKILWAMGLVVAPVTFGIPKWVVFVNSWPCMLANGTAWQPTANAVRASPG